MIVITFGAGGTAPGVDLHQNARTTPHSRMLIVARLRGGWSVPAVVAAFGVDPKTVRKWRDRHAIEGAAGLRDRSAPARQPGPAE